MIISVICFIISLVVLCLPGQSFADRAPWLLPVVAAASGILAAADAGASERTADMDMLRSHYNSALQLLLDYPSLLHFCHLVAHVSHQLDNALKLAEGMP